MCLYPLSKQDATQVEDTCHAFFLLYVTAYIFSINSFIHSFFPQSLLKNFLALNGGYFSSNERSNVFGGSTGMYLQITAKIDPVKAIHTTLTAAGTRAAYCPKCNLANRKPKAEDFMAVSMAMVRHATSPKPVSLGRKYPKRPPTKCKRRTGI